MLNALKKKSASLNLHYTVMESIRCSFYWINNNKNTHTGLEVSRGALIMKQ